MKEELENVVLDLIRKAIDIAEKTGSFLEAEIPEYINQLLLWNCIYKFILFLILPLFLSMLVIGVQTLWQKDSWDEQEAPTKKGGISILTALVGLVGALLGAAVVNLEWLQILIAPKVWLVEYAATLIK